MVSHLEEVMLVEKEVEDVVEDAVEVSEELIFKDNTRRFLVLTSNCRPRRSRVSGVGSVFVRSNSTSKRSIIRCAF
jgi:hypothetical protein